MSGGSLLRGASGQLLYLALLARVPPDAVCLWEQPLEKLHYLSWQGHMSFLVPTSASRKMEHGQPLWDHTHPLTESPESNPQSSLALTHLWSRVYNRAHRTNTAMQAPRISCSLWGLLRCLARLGVQNIPVTF